MQPMTRRTMIASGVLAGVLLLPALPTRAVEIADVEIQYSVWKNTAPPNTPCNYIYVQNKRLIYYGTAKNCYRRIGQHTNSMNHSMTLINKVNESSSAKVSNALGQKQVPNVAAVDKALADWSTEVDNDYQPQKKGRGTSDTCLAIVSENYKNQTIWFLPLDSKAGADDVETCVLDVSVGYCNRIGGGNTRASWKSFNETVTSCVKTHSP